MARNSSSVGWGAVGKAAGLGERRRTGGAEPWYLAGGVALANVQRVYQPKGAASLADSYINLISPGTGNAAPGTAPLFDNFNGWRFNGALNQYLTSGFALTGACSVIIKYSWATGANNNVLVGGRTGAAANGMFVQPYAVSNRVGYTNGSTVNLAPQLASGVLAIAGANGYRDGTAEVTTLAPASNTTTRNAYIGALNGDNAMIVPVTANIQALAMYNTILTAAQVAAITAAMNAISAPVGLGGVVNQSASIGNQLQYEYTQAWSMGVTFAKTGLPASNGAAIILSNVPNGYGYPGYELWINDTGHLDVRIIHDMGAVQYIEVQGGTNVCDGKLHRAWVTYDGSGTSAGVKIYLDGAAQTLTTSKDTLGGLTIVEEHQEFIICNQTGLEAQYGFTNGWIKDLVVDDVARDAAYAAANSDVGTAPAAVANRQLLLLCNEATGLTAADRSGNGYNATLSSPAMWICA
jgi:hypothetical protein